MDPSDIKYVLALTRRDLLLYELRAMRDSLSATISKLSNLHLWMKTLERDLPTLNSDSSNLALSRALQSLSLGKGNIESALEEYCIPPTSSVDTTSGSSTTRCSEPPASGKESTSDPEG